MFEARMSKNGVSLKLIVEAMMGLVESATMSCNDEGLSLQAMDSSHVSLIALNLGNEGFEHYRCDKPQDLGLQMANLSKVLKCADLTDTISIKKVDGEDVFTLMFESEDQERISDFNLKLMDIEQEHLGIPDQDYHAVVTMGSREFQKIVRNLQTLGDTCTISIAKDGIEFKVPESGEVVGAGSVTLRKSEGKAPSGDKKGEKGTPGVSIELNQPVELQFALRYLNHFAKATALSDTVTLSLVAEAPIVVEYPIANYGYIRYYLAPKIDEDEDDD